MDVKMFVLNEDSVEDVYMVQPNGFVEIGKEHLICKIKKSIYGLNFRHISNDIKKSIYGCENVCSK